MSYILSEVASLVTAAIEASPRKTLDQICNVLSIERHTATQALTLFCGKPFRRLQQDVLIERAVALLLDSPQSTVKEVACRLGYESPRAFARFFRSWTGVSPTEYRAAGKRPARSKPRHAAARLGSGKATLL